MTKSTIQKPFNIIQKLFKSILYDECTMQKSFKNYLTIHCVSDKIKQILREFSFGKF